MRVIKIKSKLEKSIVFAMTLMFANAALAEAEDDWFNTQRDTFNKFSEQSQSVYKTFVDENDARFLRWLRQQWKVYNRFEARVRDTSPKPEEQPAIDKADAVMSNGSLSKAPATPIVKEVLPLRKQPSLQKGKQVSINYYGHRLVLPVPVGLRSLSVNNAEPEALADAFELLAKVREVPTIESLADAKSRYQLSDWAMVQLVQQYSEVLYPPSINRSFLNWYLLSKLDLQVQMGLVKNELVVLMPAQQLVYGKPYYMIKGEAYYPIGEYIDGDLKTYTGEYFADNKKLDLSFSNTLIAGDAQQSRNLQWKVAEATKHLSINYNPNRVDYFRAYPQIDLAYYFDAPIDPQVAGSLKRQLRPILKSKTPRQQVNLLLAFMQQGFAYAMDQDQFGEENYLLPEETLYYPASDCEDRSFLFAWLVHELVELPVVGVTYPGHVAVAVAFEDSNDRNNTGLVFNGRNYTIADPTYLGSQAGQVMLQYQNIIPKVVPIL